MNPSESRRDRTTKALMVLGTASHVGKSLIAAAFCRLLAEEGFRVAPFKAQNMALNSFVTREGGRSAGAQVAQAEAAGIEPHTDMNPILLKPMGGVSQVVLDGDPIGVMSAREYYAAKDRLWPRVTAAYDRLAARFERVVLEGAGSPVEINLTEHDLTNLRMARHADAAVVLVADIERGGVFAQLVGTWELMEPADRARVVGFVINKFRGDPSLLDSGLAYLLERTGVPVLGVLPHRPDLQIDQEDSLGIDETATPDVSDPGADALDVAVARIPGLSNFTDFWPLARVPGVRVRYVDHGRDLGHPDLILLPGTRTTVRDLAWLRRTGLAGRIAALASVEDGPLVLGICGGFQMLGTRVEDPLGVESAEPVVEGLGLLDVVTRFAAEKARHRVGGRVGEAGPAIAGYEIHMGQTERGPTVRPGSRSSGSVTVKRSPMARQTPRGGSSGRMFTGCLIASPSPPNGSEGSGSVGDCRRSATAHWQAHREAISDRYAALAGLLREYLDLAPILRALERPVDDR